jgi:hypothetical protein
MHRYFLCVLFLWLPASAPVAAQTTVNPDISVIPRFLLSTNDGERLSEGIRQWSRPEFSFEELEMVVQAYLNPFARADVVLTLPGPDVEAGKLGVEEVYATVLRGLPGDLNLRLGKYRAEFGKLNMVHPHAWPFITQPLVAERFIGEEGLNDLGISVSGLLPTGDIYTRLTIDLLRGSSVGEATGIADTTGTRPWYATSARLSGFFSLNDQSDLETGLSLYTGIHDPYARERFWYWNLDFKYKYRRDSYTALTIQGEYLLNTRRAGQDRDLVPFLTGGGIPGERNVTTSGFYVYADYQFLKIFSTGVRFDWAESPYHSDDRARAVALFAGYYPVEETLGLRLHYQNTHTELPGGSRSVNLVALQVLFSLGPHKAHPF